jgi:transposase-like protein
VTGIPARPADPQLKERIVLDVLRGRLTVAAAAHLAGAHANTIYRWTDRFLEGGRAALVGDAPGSPHAEVRLKAQVADLTHALGEAAAELSSWRRSR